MSPDPAPHAASESAGRYTREIQAEVKRWSEALRTAIYGRGQTLASVERGLGWSSGYLSQILGPGSPALRVEHAFAIVEFLEVPRAHFLGGLFLGETVTSPEAFLRLIDERARLVAERVFAEHARGSDRVESTGRDR